MDAASLLSPRNPHRSVHVRRKRKTTSGNPLQPSCKENIPPSRHNAAPKKAKISTSGWHDRVIAVRSPLECITNEARSQPVAGVKHASLPRDWSLKTSMRFTSTKPFSWADVVKSGRSSEVAAGLANFVRCQRQGESVPTNYSVDENGSALRSAVQQHSMVWMHPCLPWLKLYPRTLLDGKISGQASVASSAMLQPGMQKALQDAWLDSFNSAFQLLRNGHLSYFYVCASQMTLLFRARPSATSSEASSRILVVEILISPTTKGFRDALVAEDVHFTMPLHSKKPEDQEELSVSPSSSPKESKSSWLESIGLSVDHFPSLQAHQVYLQEARSHKHDFRPESLVFIEGPSSQAFFNYVLCNSGQLIASTGSQTGLPPTILAPAAFCGASLQQLKVEVSTLRVAGEEGMSVHHAVEVSGAVLPDHQRSLCLLFRACQGDLRFTASVHEPTAAFNSLPDGDAVTFRKVEATEEDGSWTI